MDPMDLREARDPRPEDDANQAVVEIAGVVERSMVLRSSSGNEEVQACDTPLRPLWEIPGSMVKHTPEQIAEFRKMRDPEYFRELRRKKEESMAKIKEDVSKDLDLVEAPPPSQFCAELFTDQGTSNEHIKIHFPEKSTSPKKKSNKNTSGKKTSCKKTSGKKTSLTKKRPDKK